VRKQFTFYRSFASAARCIENPTERALAYETIINYALDDIEPDREKLPKTVAIFFTLIQPTLDSAAVKARAGSLGGQAKQKGNETGNEPTADLTSEANASTTEAACYTW